MQKLNVEKLIREHHPLAAKCVERGEHYPTYDQVEFEGDDDRSREILVTRCAYCGMALKDKYL